MTLCVHGTHGAPDQASTTSFNAYSGRCSMCLQIGCADNNGLGLPISGRQACHHPNKDGFVTPTLSTVVERLVQPVFRLCIAPTQAIAIDEVNPTQQTLIIDAWLAVRLAEGALKARRLRVAQAEKVRHGYRSDFEL